MKIDVINLIWIMKGYGKKNKKKRKKNSFLCNYYHKEMEKF